jgi:hypothetical protein
MNFINGLDVQLSQARELAIELLNTPPIPLTDREQIPKTGGVYIFHEVRQGGKVERIYVGLARNLRRRIHTDHVSAEKEDTMSAFRRSLNKVRNMPLGQPIKQWFQLNCTIAFLAIDDPDMRRIVESLVVKCLRSPELLNKL